MYINFTIVIQVCNFFIAYKIMAKLLFKPTFDALQQERATKNNVQLHINATKIMISNLEKEKQEQWHAFQQTFITQTPHVKQEGLFVLKGITPQLHVGTLPKDQVKRLEQEVTHSIIKRIEQIHA